jgi:hypothetical protein
MNGSRSAQPAAIYFIRVLLFAHHKHTKTAKNKCALCECGGFGAFAAAPHAHPYIDSERKSGGKKR